MVKHIAQRSFSSSNLTVTITAGQAVAQPQPEWDAVTEASWESFPASDPPAWIRRHSIEFTTFQARKR